MCFLIVWPNRNRLCIYQVGNRQIIMRETHIPPLDSDDDDVWPGHLCESVFYFFPPSSTSCYKACLLLESGIENRGTSGEGDTTPGNCPPQTVTDTLTTRRRRRRAAMATATAIAKAKEPRLHCAKHPSNPRDKEAIEAVF